MIRPIRRNGVRLAAAAAALILLGTSAGIAATLTSTFVGDGRDSQVEATGSVAPDPGVNRANTIRIVTKVTRIEARSGSVAEAFAPCPPLTKVISGGAKITGSITANLAQSFPEIRANGWDATAAQPHYLGRNQLFPGTLTAWAFCADEGKPIVTAGDVPSP